MHYDSLSEVGDYLCDEQCVTHRDAHPGTVAIQLSEGAVDTSLHYSVGSYH